MCDTLPYLAILQNIEAIQITFMREIRHYTLTIHKAKRDTTLSGMEVNKLTPTNFEDWLTAFTSLVRR